MQHVNERDLAYRDGDSGVKISCAGLTSTGVDPHLAR